MHLISFLRRLNQTNAITTMSYAVKLEKSTAKIVNTANGSTVRTIPGPFTNAIVQGDEVHLTQPNGKIRVVNIRNGSTIRTI
jgi:hypothetical protein